MATWKIDQSHTHLTFTISHFVIAKINGTFRTFEGTLYSEDNFKTSRIELVIEANSIDTNDVNRDGHLKTADFFDVEKFPQITFQSQEFENILDQVTEVDGTLTVNGVAKPVVLATTYKGNFVHPQSQNTIAVFNVSVDVPRKDFNIGASYPAAALGEVVKLESTVELIKL